MPSYRYLEDRKCLACGKVFRPRYATSKYCSKECWHATIRTTSRPCAHCGVTFQPKNAQQTLCSVACANAIRTADKSCVCAQCGKTFERPHGKARAYCSNACAAIARGQGNLVTPEPLTPRNITGKHKTASGYIMTRGAGGKRVLEHRLVMTQVLGRPLLPSERVHHKNGDRSDNRPDNLELWKGAGKKDPAGVRVVDAARDLLNALSEADRAALLAEFST